MGPIDSRVQKILNQLDIYQEIALEDYGVPASQALPVASAPDIAFRPSCTQVEPVWEPTETAWVWQNETIYKTPGQAAATDEVLLYLEAAGVCLSGKDVFEVPLVPTNEVLIKFEQIISAGEEVAPNQVMANAQQKLDWNIGSMATTFQTETKGWLLLWAVIPILGIALIISILSRIEKGKPS